MDDVSFRVPQGEIFGLLGANGAVETTVIKMLTGNRIRAAVIIPEFFEKNLLSGRPAQVQTLIDGTFPFRAQTTKGYIIAINSAVSAEL